MVEMDGPVMFGLECPAMLGAVPVVALHGAGGKIDEAAVMPASAHLDGAGGRDLLREVPARDAAERGAVELAVEMLAHRVVWLRAAGEPESFHVACRKGYELAGEPTFILHERVRLERALLDREAAAPRIDRDLDPIPLAHQHAALKCL